MSVFPVPGLEASKKMGLAAMAIIYVLAETARGGAVLESNFHRTLSLPALHGLPGAVVELFCRCDREVALDRYRARSDARHAGHFDRHRADEELWTDEVTAPIGGGWPVIEVETNHPLDIAALILSVSQVGEIS